MENKKISYKGQERGHSHSCQCGNSVSVDFDNEEVNEKDMTMFYIHGLDCAHCAMRMEQELSKLDFVQKVRIEFSTGMMHVYTKHKVNPEELCKKMQKEIDRLEKGATISYHKVAEKPVLFNPQEHIGMLIGVLFFVAGLLLHKTFLVLPLCLIAYLLIGHNILLKSFQNIKNGNIFDENFLMVVATVGAFLIHNYTEAVSVLLLYYVGEIFQSYAVNKSRASISELMGLKTDEAHVKRDGKVIDIPVEEVEKDDILIIRVGEKIPVDATVIEGKSRLDTSMMTGEAIPVSVSENDKVCSGTCNLSEMLTVKADCEYGDSSVAKILKLIEENADKKAPIEKFATRFAKVYTPIVCGLAFAIAVIPPLFTHSTFYDWIYRALTFLVISCPCALVISIPLGLFAGIGKASKYGILIKGSNYLELLKDADTFVFDKTGTITHGRFSVIDDNIVSPDFDILKYSAYGEYNCNHPIAQGIVKSYGEEIDTSTISNYHELQGGVLADVMGHHLVLGNLDFIRKYIEDVPDAGRNDGVIVYVGMDGKYCGYLVVADAVKTHSKEIIQFLSKKDKQVVMLTGDSEENAKRIANELGIYSYYAKLLPQDKVEKVEEIQHERKVVFIGDGTNDAPVLAVSDIGIAMGGMGSDAAIETADIVLMNDDISHIKTAFQISEKTNAILRQNVVFILFVKLLVLLLTVVGISGMCLGIFADVGVALLAILNAIRILA